MCGYSGFCNLDCNISTSNNIHVIKKITNKLAHRGPDEENYFINKHINLGHRRLIIVDAKNGKQPMSANYKGNTYTLVYNGQLYNTKDIRDKLINAGFSFNGYSDTEVILKAFIHYGPKILKEFNRNI